MTRSRSDHVGVPVSVAGEIGNYQTGIYGARLTFPEYMRPGLAMAHSLRFRRVSTRYPRRVSEAYGGDLVVAMASTDLEVAEQIEAWERAEGLEPRDWHAIGAEERADDEAGRGGDRR